MDGFDRSGQINQNPRMEQMTSEQLVALILTPNFPQINQMELWFILARRRDTHIVDLLLPVLSSNESNYVKSFVVSLLRAHPDVRMTQPFIDTLAHDPDVIDEAKQGLRELGSPAVPALRAALSHPSPDVRAMAAELLGVFGDEQDLVPLQTLKQSDTGAPKWGMRVRAVASQAIRRITGRLEQQGILIPPQPAPLPLTDGFGWKELLTEWSRLLLQSDILEEEPSEKVQAGSGWGGGVQPRRRLSRPKRVLA